MLVNFEALMVLNPDSEGLCREKKGELRDLVLEVTHDGVYLFAGVEQATWNHSINSLALVRIRLINEEKNEFMTIAEKILQLTR